jgi:signal transduction histidine kinase
VTETDTITDTPAQDRLRWLEGRAVVFTKLSGLTNVLVGVVAVRSGFARFPAGVALAGLAAAQAGLLAAQAVRRGRIERAWASADLGFMCLLLLANAAVIKPHAIHSWAYFAYPYSLFSTIFYGMAYASFSVLAASTSLVAGAFLAACAVNGELNGDALPNALSYLAVAPAAWLVVREVRKTSAELDLARSEAEQAAAALSRERERAYHRRILHDRVLQTLEMLGRAVDTLPQPLREHVSAEASWLRHLVETGAEREPADLLSGLEELAVRAGRLGLRVQVRAAQLNRPDSAHRRLSADQVNALIGAAGEAVANAAKHAGVPDVVIRATAGEAEVTVTVVDAGCGFDPASVTRGVGLPQSIEARLAAVGGRAEIDSAPGQGTRVVLSVVLTRRER